MIALKDYQDRVLASLEAFFCQCSKDGHPEAAFQAVQLRNNTYPLPYLPVAVAGLSTRMPYVCLRVPTGGGKTLLACYAAGLAKDKLLQAERAVVLWLVPSTTILDQTTTALRNPRHPYRHALEEACGTVEVVTIEEALRLSRATVAGQTVVIVSTIQAFRAEDTTGRKVYAQNGAFLEHFSAVPAHQTTDLEKGADGQPKPSLVNMLRLHRPIVIVDEAHNARTYNSFTALNNVRPSCVIELTATPSDGSAEIINGKKEQSPPSNVLHRVSAAEVKAEHMMKLPLRVITRPPSQSDQLLADAMTLRADLEKLAIAEAQQTGEYLRPILLIQAERIDACEPLRERLVSEFNIPRDTVKISTGTLDELKDIPNISSPKCPVRVIITVVKLREGWDCPFAYVLCSLKPTRSATAIEQLVGRVLRLPNAKEKQHPDLNCAYVFSVSDSLPEVLKELREALEGNGFTKAEAERIIIPVPGLLPLGAQPQTVRFEPGQEIDADIAEIQAATLIGKVRIDPAKGEITVFVPLDADETERLTYCVRSTEAKAQVRQLVNQVREVEQAFGGSGQPRAPSAYEQGVDFVVPRLCVRESEQLFEFEGTFLMEHRWKLSERDASLSNGYNPLERPTGQVGLVDIDATGKVQTNILPEPAGTDFIATLHQRTLALGMPDQEWTLETLIAWLDSKIRHQDITAGESAEFLRKAIRGLLAKFAIDEVSLLALDRFRLRDEIEARIDHHRESERKAAFQRFLLPDGPLATSEEQAINFKTLRYEPSFIYEGGFRFEKHYFGPKPGEIREITPSGSLTEEFKCAQFLDRLPEVQFWIRNLARKTGSFRLQTSKDWFYPDFLCQLNNECVVAVEYKGKYLYDTADAEEKRAIGAVWESRSGGRCRFVMPTDNDFSPILKAVRTAGI